MHLPMWRWLTIATVCLKQKNVVEQQNANGIIYLPKNFEQTLNRGEQAHISVYCDMNLMLAYKAIYQTSLAVALEMGKERQKDMIGIYRTQTNR